MSIENLREKLDAYIAAGEAIYGKGYYQEIVKRQEEMAALLGVAEDETTDDAIRRVVAERDRYRDALESIAAMKDATAGHYAADAASEALNPE